MLKSTLLMLFGFLSLSLSGCTDTEKFTVMGLQLGQSKLNDVRLMADKERLSYIFCTAPNEFGEISLDGRQQLFIKGNLFGNSNEIGSRVSADLIDREMVIVSASLFVDCNSEQIFDHYLKSLINQYGPYSEMFTFNSRTNYHWFLDDLRVSLSYKPKYLSQMKDNLSISWKYDDNFKAEKTGKLFGK